MTLYHKDLGFPSIWTAPIARVNLRYSRHAAEACTSRSIRQIKSISLSRCQVIELEINDNRVVKMVVRGRYDENNDICLVICPDGGMNYFVRTVWLNEITDTHKTLDTSKYARA